VAEEYLPEKIAAGNLLPWILMEFYVPHGIKLKFVLSKSKK
jgi:hypothetical protein